MGARLKAAAALAAALAVAAPQAATISLTGANATGYLAITNINNETVEPNTPGGKPFQYPYYFDPAQNLWVTIIADKLSAASIYPQEGPFTVKGKSFTDVDFAQFNLGAVSYADGLLTGSGTEVLAAGQFSLSLAASDYSPKPKARNAAPTLNEFNWTYTITPSAISGTGLTFVDGVLASADFSATVKVDVNFNGVVNPPFRLSPGFTQAGALVVAGNTFAFAMDVTQTQTGVLGTLTDSRLVFNRAGTIDQITPVPEPQALALLLAGLAVVAGAARRKTRAR
jgi:hypothetical protein